MSNVVLHILNILPLFAILIEIFTPELFYLILKLSHINKNADVFTYVNKIMCYALLINSRGSTREFYK